MSVALHSQIDPSGKSLRQDFQDAQPFSHLVIEPFLDASFAERLLAEFPGFERGNARDENGKLGRKSTFEKMAELGGPFAELDALIQTKPFLDWLAQATGIPGLLYDPDYFGGGTHENRSGQELDPHVDFNRHPDRGWHRRINLIIYLNPHWQQSWGGNLQLHRDPRSANDEVISIEPRFNRAVIFATHDHSWHGFPPIIAPPDQPELSRKSIALYFYTQKRPKDTEGLDHSTIYVERPLPERFRSGRTLDEADVQELQRLLSRRDQHLQRIYRDVAMLTTEIADIRGSLSHSRVERLAHMVYRSLRKLGLIRAR